MAPEIAAGTVPPPVITPNALLGPLEVALGRSTSRPLSRSAAQAHQKTARRQSARPNRCPREGRSRGTWGRLGPTRRRARRPQCRPDTNGIVLVVSVARRWRQGRIDVSPRELPGPLIRPFLIMISRPCGSCRRLALRAPARRSTGTSCRIALPCGSRGQFLHAGTCPRTPANLSGVQPSESTLKNPPLSKLGWIATSPAERGQASGDR